jgi:hypothetical protein
MGTLELLVKLASFGTAGVCVLAVFIVGKYILALPKDSPDWKVSLMRRYQNMCIFIAVISFLAGGVNAYFNQGKIETANTKAEKAEKTTTVVQDRYTVEQQKLEVFKTAVTEQLQKLQDQIARNPTVSEETKSSVRELNLQAREFRIMPVDEFVKKPVERRIITR